MSNYPLAPLSEVTVNFDGRRVPVKGPDRKPGPYPYYGASGVVDHVHEYLFDGEYLLIAEDGENLRTRNTPIAFRATGKFWVNNHAHIVQGNEKASTRYLEYAVNTADISSYLTGSIMPKLTQGNLNRLPVVLPPLDVQRSITSILGSLDDKIELNLKINETLERTARAIFKSWFIDFDPVRAKAEGKKPFGMDDATAALFPDRFEQSEFGEIPKGWKVTAWAEHIILEYGKGLKNYDNQSGPVPVYGTNGPIGFTEVPLCPHPGIVVGRKGAYRGIHFSATPFFVIDTAFFVSPKANLDLRWAYYSMIQIDLNAMDSGSAIPSTSRDEFYNLRLALPPTNLQNAFSEVMRAAWDLQASNNENAKTLSDIRDLLLPRLLSGEISLKEADRHV